MGRLDNRLTIVLLAMMLGMTILSVLCYATIFVQPNIPFNPLSPQRATSIAEEARASLPTTAPLATAQKHPPQPARLHLQIRQPLPPFLLHLRQPEPLHHYRTLFHHIPAKPTVPTSV